MRYAMDQFHTIELALFLAGAFAAAFVTGLAGFAFAIVAAAVWLHFGAGAGDAIDHRVRTDRAGCLSFETALAARRAARRVSALRRRDLSDDGALAWRRRHDRRRHADAVPDWIAGTRDRHLGRAQAVRQARRPSL